MEYLTLDSFGVALMDNREHFNELFRQTRHHRPGLRADRFYEHLKSTLAPIVNAASTDKADAQKITQSLYGISLDLSSRGFMGGNSSFMIEPAWKELLPLLTKALRQDPRATAAFVSNAIYNLGLTKGAHPGQWVTEMKPLTKMTQDLDLLRQAGVIVAWRCGLATFRDLALKLAETLPTNISAYALGLTQSNLLATISKLKVNPWYWPSDHTRGLRVVATLGEFKGYGGQFLRPPRVFWQKGFYASDGQNTYRLFADRFGHSFVPVETKLQTAPTQNAHITPEGEIIWGSTRSFFSELAEPTSWAVGQTTMAVTCRFTHKVVMLTL